MAIELTEGYRPGAIGAITALHGQYYSEHWNFDLFFEAKVAKELSQFLERYDPETDRLWLAVSDDRIVGSLVIDGGEPNASVHGAHLRWFILHPVCHGKRLGKDLMQRATDFCDRRGDKRIYLTTFAGLDAARNLYESAGFNLVSEKMSETWGVPVTEQLFERTAPRTTAAAKSYASPSDAT